MVCHGKAPHILLWARVPWGIIWCSEQYKYKYTQTKYKISSLVQKLALQTTHIHKHKYKSTLTKMTQETTHILHCKDYSSLDAFDTFADIDANFMHHGTAF